MREERRARAKSILTAALGPSCFEISIEGREVLAYSHGAFCSQLTFLQQCPSKVLSWCCLCSPPLNVLPRARSFPWVKWVEDNIYIYFHPAAHSGVCFAVLWVSAIFVMDIGDSPVLVSIGMGPAQMFSSIRSFKSNWLKVAFLGSSG